MTTRLEHITQRAEANSAATFNNLFSFLNQEMLCYAFRKLKRDKAPGADGQTVEQCEENLQDNLLDLEARLPALIKSPANDYFQGALRQDPRSHDRPWIGSQNRSSLIHWQFQAGDHKCRIRN